MDTMGGGRGPSERTPLIAPVREDADVDDGRESGYSSPRAHAEVNASRSSRFLLALGMVVVVTAAATAGVYIAVVVNGRASPSEDGFATAAVATDAAMCSQIGVDTLKRGGGAVDAAVAATLCIGVVNSHSSGIGGGGFMVIYNGTQAETIDFREMAPADSEELMFAGFPDCATDGGQGDSTRCPSRLGGLAVGVPGELRGLEEAHRRHGRLPWSDVISPIIALCRDGFAVTGANAAAINASLTFIMEDPILRETFIRADGEPYQEGDTMRRPRLAATLELVAQRGADALYRGDVADRIVALIQNNSFRQGILTLEDLANYRPIVRGTTVTTYHGRTVFSAPPPASGVVLSLILNILETYNLSCTEGRTVLEDHRIIEAFKFGYGHRTWISDPCCGDPDGNTANVTCTNVTHCNLTTSWVEEIMSKADAAEMRAKISDTATNHTPEYYGGEYDVQDTPGTTHISVVGPDGDAVSVTSTINLNFGAKLMTEDGIILNNQMDDFSTPGFSNAFGFAPSPSNFIWPFKRPLSSSSPVIVVDDDGLVQFVAGASGGSKITTATAQVLLNVLSFCKSVRDAVDMPRIHHQLLPVWISGERDYPQSRTDELESIGHYWNYTSTNGVVQAIARGTVGPVDADPALLYAASDGKRKPGARAYGY